MRQLVPLGEEIKRLLEENQWSQRELAIKADLDPANVSRLMRGKQDASHAAIEKLAGALQTDAAYLKRLGGIWAPPPPDERDPDVEALALRLNDLPAATRSPLIDMINNQLDTIEHIVSIQSK